MAAIIDHSIEINAPVGLVFDYVDDFTNIGQWMWGLDSIKPVTDQLRGIGAEYDGTMKLGVTLHSRVRCVGYEINRCVEIASVGGIENAQRWTFTSLGSALTRVDAHISYTLPGGPAGKAIERAVRPVVGLAVKHSSEALVRNVEALHR